MRILMSGTHGFIGGALKPHLEAQSHVVKTLSAHLDSSADYFWNNLNAIPWNDFDAVIHLAGENIFGRWTRAKKKSLWDSRIDLTQSLADCIVRADPRPRVFICASAVAIYGDTGKKQVDEQAAHGKNFIAKLAAAWEHASQLAYEKGVRTVSIRMGIVLSPNGGALAKMLPLFRMGLGGSLGDGKQLQSFVALQDVLRAITFILEHKNINGPVNLVCPQALTQREFAKILSKHLHRPHILRMPVWVLRLAFSQMADEVLLANACAQPKKLHEAGFRFQLQDLHSILSSYSIGTTK